MVIIDITEMPLLGEGGAHKFVHVSPQLALKQILQKEEQVVPQPPPSMRQLSFIDFPLISEEVQAKLLKFTVIKFLGYPWVVDELSLSLQRF